MGTKRIKIETLSNFLSLPYLSVLYIINNFFKEKNQIQRAKDLEKKIRQKINTAQMNRSSSEFFDLRRQREDDRRSKVISNLEKDSK